MMQSMSKSKEEKKIMMQKASAPQKLMTTCVGCMMFGDVANYSYYVYNQNHDKEHEPSSHN